MFHLAHRICHCLFLCLRICWFRCGSNLLLISSLEQTLKEVKGEETKNLLAAPQKSIRVKMRGWLSSYLYFQFLANNYDLISDSVLIVRLSLLIFFGWLSFWVIFGPEYTIKCKQDTKVTICFIYIFCIKTTLTRCTLYTVQYSNTIIRFVFKYYALLIL